MQSITTPEGVSDSFLPFFVEILQGCHKLVELVTPPLESVAEYLWQNWPATGDLLCPQRRHGVDAHGSPGRK